MLACASVMTWAYGTHPWGRQSSWTDYRDDAYAREAREAIRFVRPTDSVAAPVRLLAHVAARKNVYARLLAGPDVVIVEQRPEQSFGESAETHAEQLARVARIGADLERRFGYRKVFGGDLLALYRRERGARPSSERP